jgi:hypothetical protein
MKKKLMIVLWKWDGLKHVNSTVFSAKELEHLSQNIEKGKAVFYQEYLVESSRLCPEATFLAVSIYNEPATRNLLYVLLDHYVSKDQEIILLLHRANFYEDRDIESIRRRYRGKIQKCFLFADGRDYIYYKTEKSGLLDDTGRFFVGRDPDTQVKVITFEDGVVKQPYFDRAWYYYSIEFEIKVFQLKEELFDVWFPFLLPYGDEQISKKALLDALDGSKDRLLLYRLKSFLGYYEQSKIEKKNFEDSRHLKKERDAIEDLEYKEKKSYDFDDCIVNLKQEESSQPFVAGAYRDARMLIEHTLFKDIHHPVKKEVLRNIADKLNHLVSVIPGQMD